MGDERFCARVHGHICDENCGPLLSEMPRDEGTPHPAGTYHGQPVPGVYSPDQVSKPPAAPRAAPLAVPEPDGGVHESEWLPPGVTLPLR